MEVQSLCTKGSSGNVDWCWIMQEMRDVLGWAKYSDNSHVRKRPRVLESHCSTRHQPLALEYASLHTSPRGGVILSLAHRHR